MQRNFLGNLFILVGLNLLIKPFWILGVDRSVQNAVGNAEYGVYANVFAFSLLFVMLLDFGINNYASAHVARHPQLAGKQFSSLISLKLILSAAYLLVTWAAGWAYGFRDGVLGLLVLLSVNQVLAFLILFIRSHVSGLQLFRTDALMSVSDRALMILFAALLLWTTWADVTIVHFALAQGAGYLVSLVICFLVLQPHLGTITPVVSKALLISFLKQTWPYALLALVMTLYTRTDVILLKKVRPDGDLENGIYAQGNRLLEAANMLAAMISTMLLPLFSRMISEKSEMTQVIRLGLSILFLPATAFCLFCFSYRYEIMSLLYPSSNEYSAEVFGIAIFSFAGLASMYIFGTWLTAAASMRQLLTIAGVCLGLNVVLNLALVPGWGAYGAACAAVSTNLLAGLLNAGAALRKGRFNLGTGDAIRCALFVILVAATEFSLRHFSVPLVGAGITTLLVSIILLPLLGIVRYASIAKETAMLLRR